LLSTLLIANAIALESLPIFIEKALPSYLAIILCTFMVVFFAEIIPQAYCTGPDQL
jgi:metal transporter CNNM